MPLHQSKLLELESRSGNSILESNEHVDNADTKLAEKFRPSGHSPPSLSSKVKNHTLTNSLSNKATSVTKSRQVPSNAAVHSGDAQIVQEHVLNQRKDGYPTNVDQITRKIQQPPSKSAKNLFKDVVANLVNTTEPTGSVAVGQRESI
uniref:WH2 domain-containing protein n=1 Tax=Angiostrongylus cantonensis TaxID=6313 RepID=A0A0K0D8C8_ANGCA